jgi:hypothetical protein
VATQENPSAWAYVKSFKAASDGRGAVLALALQCGGRATQQARSKKAHAILSAAIWDGRPRRNYTFENFNAKFKDAFDELEQLNEPIPGHVQVTMYIKSIQDPKLEPGIGNILASDRMLNSFEDASAYHLQRAGVANTWGRTVSEAGQKRGPEPYVPDPDRPHIHDGSYADEDWNELTQDEQDEVKQLHKEKAKANKAKAKKAKANKAKPGANDDDAEEQADENDS